MPPGSAVNVTIAGGYYFRSINRLIADLQPLFDIDHHGEPVVVDIDMRKLTFLGPCGLALLLATLHRLRERGLAAEGSYIHNPTALGVANYLHRIDFYKLLFAERDLPDYVGRRQPLGMRECRHFPSDAS